MTARDENTEDLIRRALDARNPLRGGVELPPFTLTLAQMRALADERAAAERARGWLRRLLSMSWRVNRRG